MRRRVPMRDVEDVTQAALLRVHRGLPAVRSGATLLGWLSAVVAGAIADHHRARCPPHQTNRRCSRAPRPSSNRSSSSSPSRTGRPSAASTSSSDARATSRARSAFRWRP
ncbi:MAG: hypothetical protein INH41_02255 [Myxococcaceae bacterium]|nr:hypothetical protein [Myxococcaceae bacterium]